jgi:hypothetical protein
MTSDKQPQRPRRINGRANRAQPEPGVVAPRGRLTSARFSAAPDEPPARVPLCRSLTASNGKLAGFGGPAAPEIQPPRAPVPIWFAALLATECQARTNGQDRIVRWDCVLGRAVYTNHGAEEETIEPLGVCLQRGHTVAVSWIPGETAYTVEIFGQFDCVA